MQSLDLGLSLSAGPFCAVLPSRAGINVLTIQVQCKARAPYDEIVFCSMKGEFEICLISSRLVTS